MKKSKVEASGLAWPDPEKVRLAGVQFAPYNPRRMSPERMRQLKASLMKHGMVLNLVVQRRSEAHGESVLIGGHQRITAARELCKERGWPEPEWGWATFKDCSDAVAKQLNVALNNIEGEFDPHLLGLLLADVGDLAPTDILAMGLGEDNVAQLIRDASRSPDEQAAELEREAQSLIGGFERSIVLTVDFASLAERDKAKEVLSARAKAEGRKAGAVLLEALLAPACLRPKEGSK